MKGGEGDVRLPYAELSKWLGEVRPELLDYRRREAELVFRRGPVPDDRVGEETADDREDRAGHGEHDRREIDDPLRVAGGWRKDARDVASARRGHVTPRKQEHPHAEPERRNHTCGDETDDRERT